MNQRLAPLLLMLGLLAGCASVPLAPGCMRLGRGGEFCPLPPAALPAMSGTQLVSVTHAGETQTFLGRLQIDSGHLRLAGLSLLGTELFTLAYDGQHVTGHAIQGGLHPELLVAMLELTLAPTAELPARLHGLSLSVSRSGSAQVREIREGSQVIARIKKPSEASPDTPTRITIPPAKLALQFAPLAGTGGTP